MNERETSSHHAFPIERQLGAVCTGIASVILLSLIIQGLANSVLERLFPSLATQDWYQVALSSISMYLVAMPISYFALRLGKKAPSSAPKKLTVGGFCALLSLSFGIAILGNLIGSAVQALIFALTGKAAINPVETATMSTPFWANLLFGGILAPVAEEIVYRKLVIDRLRPLGELFAVLFSGLLFGLVHGNFSQFFYATMFGFLAGAVYVYTGKLRYTVALHIAVNLTGGVLYTEIIRAMGGTQAAQDLSARLSDTPVAAYLYIGYTALMMLCVLAMPFVLFLLHRRFCLQRRAEDKSPSEIGRAIAQNPACWLLGAIFLILFIA